MLCMLWGLTLRYGEGNVVMLVLVENGNTYDQLTYRVVAFIFGYNTYWSCHCLLFLVTVWSGTLMTKVRYTHDQGTVHTWPRYGTHMTKVRYTHDQGTVHSWPRYGTRVCTVPRAWYTHDQGPGTLMTWDTCDPGKVPYWSLRTRLVSYCSVLFTVSSRDR